jgi:hypothetical protein
MQSDLYFLSGLWTCTSQQPRFLPQIVLEIAITNLFRNTSYHDCRLVQNLAGFCLSLLSTNSLSILSSRSGIQRISCQSATVVSNSDMYPEKPLIGNALSLGITVYLDKPSSEITEFGQTLVTRLLPQSCVSPDLPSMDSLRQTTEFFQYRIAIRRKHITSRIDAYPTDDTVCVQLGNVRQCLSRRASFLQILLGDVDVVPQLVVQSDEIDQCTQMKFDKVVFITDYTSRSKQNLHTSYEHQETRSAWNMRRALT